MAPKASPKPLYGATVEPRPRRDGTTSYDVRYRSEGQSRRLAFTTQRDAEKWAGIVRQIGPAAALDFLNITTAPGTPTVDEYFELYVAAKSGIEGRTIFNYRAAMRLHISPTLGHLPLDAVSKATIAGWVNMQAASGAAAKSIGNRHGLLSAMFQTAVDDGLISANPCAKTKLPETERLEMVFLTPDEFTTFLSYIPARHQALVLTLAATGMRWGEVTALRPADVDLERMKVTISRAWKRGGAGGFYVGPPKTKRSRRTIDIPPDLIPHIRPLLNAGTEYVFTNGRGKPVRQPNFYESAWSPARRLANGLPPFDKAKASKGREWAARAQGVWDGVEPAADPIRKWPRIHDLRHSNVGWLLAQGVGIDVISRRLGHESIQTTMDVYGHVAQDRLEAAGRAIGVALSGAMPAIEE